MVKWQNFIEAVEKGLGEYRTKDQDQIAAIKQGKNKNVVIYAGPGTGKTATLTLRILKLVLVDGVLPQNIVATTFTRKASKELRSRLIDWSESITTNLQLQNLPDWNLMLVDTLDSIAEQLISDYRSPGQPKEVVIPQRTSRQLWVDILLDKYPQTHQEKHLIKLSKYLENKDSANFQDAVNAVSLLRERAIQDNINFENFFLSNKPYKNVGKLIDKYEKSLKENFWLDFSTLELTLLKRLRSRSDMQEFKSNLQVILVDEYQDTNKLQEKIYFELARYASKNGGGITVVGDDDQSLYRFRGSKVELFSNFQKRMSDYFGGSSPKIITLRSNYRSTGNIVTFSNHFVDFDDKYQSSRAQFILQGKRRYKPSIVKKRPDHQDEFPLLIMLRESREKLANGLSKFIHKIFKGEGYKVEFKSKNFLIIKEPKKGRIADAALLCASPKEKQDSLPSHLRSKLSQLPNPIQVFNPRGRNLATFEPVSQLMGLVLYCVDPDREAQTNINHSRETHNTLDLWRQQALLFKSKAKPVSKAGSLPVFISNWQKPDRYQANLNELIHGLISWFPYFQNDPEGLAILEQLMRIVTESSILGRYDMNIINHKNSRISLASRKEIVRHFCFAVAGDAGEMDEDLLLEPPRDRFPIMSIHQAKGLEYPLTIVDVCSRFKMNHPKQRFARFPDNASRSHLIENLLESHGKRKDPLQRAFDDLNRLYYVAYTRAQDVLVLAGLGKNFTKDSIMNIALGWDRTGHWHWSSIVQDYRSGESASSLSHNGNNIPIAFI